MEQGIKEQEQKQQSIAVHQLEDKDYFPFNVLQVDEEYKIILGQTIASPETFYTLEDAELYIKSKPYDLILTLVGESINMLQQQKKQEHETK